MLPQTRQKLRIFSLVCLGIGGFLLTLTWLFAEPDIVVRGARIPTFWDVLLSQAGTTDEVQWKLLDMTLSYEVFSNLLRGILLLTVCTSALTIVVVYQDIKLTKK
jgi:hypothetical protein